MGKYTGYKVFQEGYLNANDSLLHKKKNEFVTVTLCKNIKSLKSLANDNLKYNDFDKQYLAELFTGIKLISLVEHYETMNKNIMAKYENDDRFDKLSLQDFLKGRSLEVKQLTSTGSVIKDEETLKDINAVNENNKQFSAFKNDIINNYEGRYSNFKKDCEHILTKFGFKEKDISSFFDVSYLTDKNYGKLDDQSKDRFDEDFSNFVNKFEEIKLEKQKNDLNIAETKGDYELKDAFEYSYNHFYKEPRQYNTIESKSSKSDLLVSAVSANIEMRKRLSDSPIKKIPILRWFSKEFRKEHKLYKESSEVIKDLQGNHDIKGMIENGASVDEIFNEIKQVQIEHNETVYDEFVVEEKNNFKKQVFEKDPNNDINKENNLVSNKVEINLDLKETKEASKK